MHVCKTCKKEIAGDCAPQNGSSVQSCPVKKGAIWIHVTDKDGNDIETVACTSPGSKSTDDSGIATFDPLASKDYDAELAPLSSTLTKLYELPTTIKKTVTVSDGEITYVNFVLTPKINVITPTVTLDQDTSWFEPTLAVGTPVEATLDYTQSRTDSTYAGDGKFAWDTSKADLFTDKDCKNSAGSTSPIAVPNGELKGKKFYVRAKQKGAVAVTLTLDDKKEKPFDVKGPANSDVKLEQANLATPKLEIEYKVALLERALSANQPSTDAKKLFAQPTYIILSLLETVPGQPYKGKVTVDSDSKLEFFKTKDCASTDKAGPEWTDDDIRGADAGKLKVWARGTAEGKFDLKVTLEAKTGPKVYTAKDPAKEEFGSVKLVIALSPKDGASPFDPKDMPDGDKIGKGSVLHVQDGKNFGRLKATIKALDAAKWPAGTDDYELVLTPGDSGGKVKVFDAATDGTEISPPKFKKSALTADKVIYIEGATESNKLRDGLFDAGIINGSGELKHYGDWANLTIVKVEAVKPSDQFPTESTDYSGDKYKQFVNQGDKRKIKIKAKLTKDIEGVKLNFILLADENNQKSANWGYDMPSTWTPGSFPDDLKPDDQASGVHVNVKTVAGGTAEAEVKLSIIGGDKYYAGAFVDECAHFRTVKKKETGKPTPVVSKVLNVWRKFWYQVTCASTSPDQSMGAATGGMDKVKIDMLLSKKVSFDPSTIPPTTKGVFYEEWRLKTGGTSDKKFVIGSHNSTYFRGKFDTSGGQAPLVHIMVCDQQWDDGGESGIKGPIEIKSFSSARTSAEFKLPMDQKRWIIDPPFQGGDLLVSGRWENHDGSIKGTFSNADLVIEQTRTSLAHLKIKFPVNGKNSSNVDVPAGTPTTTQPFKVWLNVKQGSGSWLGESDGPHILAVPVPSAPYDFCDTIVHEVGHSFNQSRGSSTHPPLPAGVAARGTNRYDKNGSHCKYDYPAHPCVMYESGPQANGIRAFCTECHPYVLIDEVKPF